MNFPAVLCVSLCGLAIWSSGDEGWCNQRGARSKASVILGVDDTSRSLPEAHMPCLRRDSFWLSSERESDTAPSSRLFHQQFLHLAIAPLLHSRHASSSLIWPDSRAFDRSGASACFQHSRAQRRSRLIEKGSEWCRSAELRHGSASHQVHRASAAHIGWHSG